MRRVKILGLLLACGAMLSACKTQGEAGRAALKEQGYEVNLGDFFRAAGNGATAVMTEMVKGGVDAKEKNAEGDTALHEAARKGAVGSMEFLLGQGLGVDELGKGGATPLMEAAAAGQVEAVRWLIHRGANVRVKDGQGVSVLMRAVLAGNGAVVGELAPLLREDLDHALLVAALEGKKDVIDVLTSYGASIYARSEDGKTPLMLAAEKGHGEAVKLLLELGSNRYTADAQGHTAMFYAGQNEEIQKLLNEKEVALPTDDELSREMEQQVERQAGGKVIVSGGGTASAVEKLAGAKLEKSAAGNFRHEGVKAESGETVAQSPLVMRSFRQRILPVQVREANSKGAKVVVQEGGNAREMSVQVGERVPGTNLVVRQITPRRLSEKDQNTDRDASIVELEDVSNGVKRQVVAGTPSTANEPVALVEDRAAKKRYVARIGEEFTDASGKKFRVADLRPRQMVLENRETGEMLTLPIRGARD